MDLPLGYHSNGENLVCKLNKLIYGLGQPSRQWFSTFATSLLAAGFTQSYNDYSLFVRGSGSSFVALLVYVDDIMLARPDSSLLQQVKQEIQATFKLKDLGSLKYFLGLEIARSKQGIFLSQRKYTLSLMEATSHLASKLVSLLMDPNLKLSSTDGEPLQAISQYRKLIGRLLYVTISRPDRAFAVNKLSQFVSNPWTTQLQAVTHLLRCLKQSPGQGIFFSIASSLQLQAYANADWASCIDTRKSVSGFCVFISDSLVSWKSKKQTSISISSAKSEYRSLASVASELTWMKSLLQDFHLMVNSAIVYCDS